MSLRIDQFHYSARAHDAVTNHMLAIRERLAAKGIGGEIYVVESRPGDELPVRRLSTETRPEGNLLLIHHSQGNPRLGELLALPMPKALVYHNITPARHFPHDPVLAELCDRGREQLAAFRGKLAAALAVSEYNARELEERGLGPVTLLPLLDLSADDPARRFPPRGATNGGDLLFVGKLTPHKDQALLVRAMHYLAQMPGKSFRLVLLGDADPIYGDYLRLLARGLGLADTVVFAGRVPDEALVGWYRRAVAFVSASRHEGFGLPLVEAMRAGLPVIACHAAGVRETLGGAGLLLRTRRPHRVAEVVAAALESPEAVAAILQGQERRLAELRNFQNGERLLETLVEVAARALTAHARSVGHEKGLA